MITCFVVNRNFNLVCLINIELVQFIGPAIVSRWLGAAFDTVFDFDVNESLGTAAEAASGCVVDVGNGMDTKRKVAAEGLSLAWDAQAVVLKKSISRCKRCGENSIPSRSSALSMST